MVQILSTARETVCPLTTSVVLALKGSVTKLNADDATNTPFSVPDGCMVRQ